MLTTLIVLFYLKTIVNADDVTIVDDNNLLHSTHLNVTPPTTSSVTFDEDAELVKIAESCFSGSNYEELAGYTIRRFAARILGDTLIEESVDIIGLTELRRTLNLAPLPPWKHFNRTDPSENELSSASTIQEYYDLKEPKSFWRTLDSDYLYEHNILSSIPYLDKRFPSIRIIFRHNFEEKRQSFGVLDRKAIDRMIDEFSKVNKKIRSAIEEMDRRETDCWND